ncbi:MAG: AMP-binding protein [Pseudomonadales bacterium]|nr:AMP-binding protein [Pseudomonadales bacterium]MBP9033070.1 AMP-binding protein [Pseudomonadales bacterium]
MELIERARAAAGMPQHVGLLEYDSVQAVLAAAAARFPDKPALSSLGHTLTFRELDRLTAAFASWLQHHTDLQPGDRIAIQMPNLVQYPVVCLGALRAGLIVVNTNPLYTAREMEHQFQDSGATALVLLANMAANAAPIIPRTGIRHVVVTELADLHPFPRRLLINAGARYLKKMVPPYHIPGAVGLRQALALGGRSAHHEAAPAPDGIAVLQYTGGTTGVSKGAMLSHGNIVANMQQAGVLFSTYDFREGEETLLLPLPLYHIYAFNACLGMLARGGHTVLVPNPRDLKSLVAAFRNSGCTGFAGLNTLFVALCNDADFRAVDFSRLKLTMSGGMALTMAAAGRWKEVTGVEIVEGYGMSETSPVISVNPVNANRLGTIGIAVPSTEVRIVDDNGNEVAAGEPGELVVRGPQVMLGYWNQPGETAKVLSPDGWLHTGDVAVVTPEGYLKIVDRKKDMVVVSGFNVYPNEIEEVVVAHPDVLECAAVGIPDERTGEALRVFVVPRHAGLTPEALREFCRENLTGYKMPREFVIRAELPKSNVGKILRRELRDQ